MAKDTIKPIVNIATQFALINHLAGVAADSISAVNWKLPGDTALITPDERGVLNKAAQLLGRLKNQTTETDYRYVIEALYS